MKTFLTSKWTRLAALALLAVMVALSAMAIASVPAFAQSSSPTPNAPQQSGPSIARIAAMEKVFANENTWLATQASNLQKIEQWDTRAQDLIDKAKAKGWDVSGLQDALNAFKAQIANAQGLHNTANAILTHHPGFDANGKVTGAAAAVQTVRDARQSLGDARIVMRQAVLDLRSVILNFRKEHKGSGQPAAPSAMPSGSGS
jgi:uncharacterized protein YdeI (BOF family)